jgi:conjugal transfer mating pair stabilization protein TraG
LVKLASLVGLIYIVGKNIYEGRDASSIKTQFTWVFKYIVMTGALMLPAGTVVIKDVVTHVERKVDNLPVGLTLFAGIFNSFGHAITTNFEKNFTPVNYLPYHQYGLVFGSQMVAETRNLKIEDPIFWENMYNFIDRCVIDDVMIGTKYNIKDLKTTNNIWRLISDNASTFFSFDFRNASNSGRSSREIVTCRIGAERLSKQWNSVYDLSLKSLTSGLLGVSGKKNPGDNMNNNPASNHALSNVLQSNIQSSLNFLGSGTTAQEYLKQQMMINSIQNGPAGLKGSRAASTQIASWVTAGEIARQSLPIMKAVIEAIVYSSFIFVYFMMMLPSGWAIFVRYLSILFWLQLWAPLYAVLNMMMSLFAYQFTSGEFASGINMANLTSVSNIHQGISAMSGYFSASIPFIAKVIIDSSSHGLVQLASSVTGSLQSIAGQVANEALSNNMNLDNTSIGNLQYANSNMLKSDHGSSFRGSSAEWQMQNGGMEKVQASGEFMTMTGQGLTASTGHTRVNTNEMLGANWSKSLGENASEVEALSHDTTQLAQNTFNRSSSMLAQYAERASEGETKDLSTTSQYAQSTAKTVDFIKNLQENHNFSHQQAAEVAVLASASLNGSAGVGSSGGSRSSFCFRLSKCYCGFRW